MVTVIWMIIVVLSFLMGVVLGSITTISAIQSSGYAVVRTKDRKYVVLNIRDKIKKEELENG